MKVTRSSICAVVIALMEIPDLKSAKKFLSPDLVVKATRRHRPDARCRHEEILLSIGKPNHAERKMIALWDKAGEKFPNRRMPMDFYKPKSKSKLRRR